MVINTFMDERAIEEQPFPVQPVPELAESEKQEKRLTQHEMDRIELNNYRGRVVDLEVKLATLGVDNAKLKIQLMEHQVQNLQTMKTQALDVKADVVKEGRQYANMLKAKYQIASAGLGFNPETGLIIEDER